MSSLDAAEMALRSMFTELGGSGLGTRVQALPSQWRTSEPSRTLPTAQISFSETTAISLRITSEPRSAVEVVVQVPHTGLGVGLPGGQVGVWVSVGVGVIVGVRVWVNVALGILVGRGR